MVRCRLRVGAAAAVVALMVVGCAQDDSALEVEPADANAGSGDDGGSPGPDGPGPDDPVDQPTLSLPGLPIGGPTYRSIDGNHPDNQCARVTWIVSADAADLVPGVAVAVTGVGFDPEVFTVAPAGCDNDAPPCPGFVFTADARVCNLAVAPIPGSDTTLGSYRFSLVGRIDCGEIGGERCRAFRDAVAAEPKLSLGLDPPVTGTEDGSDETDGDESDTDDDTGDGTGEDTADGTDGEEADDPGTEGDDSADDAGSGEGSDTEPGSGSGSGE